MYRGGGSTTPSRRTSRNSMGSWYHTLPTAIDKKRSMGAVVMIIIATIGLCTLLICFSAGSSSSKSRIRSTTTSETHGHPYDAEEDPYELIRRLTERLTDAEAQLKEQEELHQQVVLSQWKTNEIELVGGGATAAEGPVSIMTSEEVTQRASYPIPFHHINEASDCHDRFGLGLADVMASKKVTICAETPSITSSAFPSSMECYPHNPPHKANRDRPWDMFCVAHNFFIDFSKVKGEPQSKVESHAIRQGNYHMFEAGSLFATCRPTSAYQEAAQKFMPHHRLQMNSFRGEAIPPARDSYKVIETPTYLLARDEDCENLFHSSADHMNMYLVVEHVLKMSFDDIAVVLFDRHVNGPFLDLIQTAFSPNYPVKRAKDFEGKTILFKKLIFHLESPAGIIFPSVTATNAMHCHSSDYYHAYRRHVLQAFDLWDVPPPIVPTITFSVRKRTAEKNVGRVLANEEEVVQVMKQGNMVKYQTVDLATLSFREQLKIMRNTNIYIGIHGAGLMHAYFLAEEAILMEIHPSYRLDRHFRLAAKQSGKTYMPIRLTTPISCQSSSDNLQVDIDEFRGALDGAVRIARNFGRGVAECGLRCPPSILALDKSLDAHYGAQTHSESRATPLNTQFPCRR